GEPLADFLRRESPLAPADAVALVRQLADALAAAHAAGIIHRDLKPENIIYDPPAHSVKLLDFGIARDAEQPLEERLTRTGFFVGTLQYVAPEALSGELVDGRADIYSLAKITYYMLTGRHPHDGRSPRELFQQLLNGKPTPLSQASDRKFPAPLEAAVMKGLARHPDGRQPTVTAFAEDLESALAQTKDAAKPRGTSQRIEGCFASGDSVVIVEDVLTTGGSAREAIAAVQQEGGQVLGVMAVLDREAGGREALERDGFLVEAFLTATDLGLGR